MDTELWGCTIILSPKWPIYLNQVLKKHEHWFKLDVMYFLAPFILLNNKKRKIRFTVMRSNHFRPICPKWEFFQKNHNMISLYILTPFIVQNLQKILRADQKLWTCPIFRPKMPKNLLVHLAVLIHVYLHAKKSRARHQSIHEILTIKEYWNLIGWKHFWP